MADAVEPPAGGVSPLGALLASAAEEKPGLAEARRIASLRLGRRLTIEEAEEVSRTEVLPEWFRGEHLDCPRDKEGRPIPYRLWRQQAEALLAFDETGGGFFPLPVGRGKTFISFLCLRRAHQPKPYGRGIKRSLLVVPARGMRKLVRLDVPKARRILGFDVPVHVMGGLKPARRLALARSGLPGVYCTSYSLIQQPQAAEEMDAIFPGLVVADEAHILANAQRNSATRKRIFHALGRTHAMFVALSGTMSRKSFLDCWPLIVAALKERAPVPVAPGFAEFWAAVLDASSSARPSIEHLEAMEPIRLWAIEQVRSGRIDPGDVGGPLSPDPDGLRRACRLRRNNAPGVVAGGEDELGVTLWIQNRPCFAQAGAEGGTDEEKQSALERRAAAVEARLEETVPRPTPEDWVPREAFAGMEPLDQVIALQWAVARRSRTPNGDEIEHGFHLWKPQYELSAGIYHELTWPEPEQLADEWRVSVEQAQDELDQAEAHRLAVSAYVREVRDFLNNERHQPGLDTPLLVWNACMRKDSRIPKYVYEKWLKVKAVERDSLPKRISRVRRVCDWKIRAAVAWAREVEEEHGRDAGGLVWCWHNEVMEWAREIFEAEFGPDRVLYCPRGPAADSRIMDPSSARFFTIASIAAHGEQKDLPHYQHQVCIQFPRPANVAEQLLGRTHRYGQKADEIFVRTLNTLDFDHGCYSACLHDAMWLSQAESLQKVIYASYDPPPLRHPAKFLQERGYALEHDDQDAALRMVFGGAEATVSP